MRSMLLDGNQPNRRAWGPRGYAVEKALKGGSEMLLTLGQASPGDYGEESIVGRLLLSLVFNEYAGVNKDGGAFVAFARRCLGIAASVDDMYRATATVEFQANRCNSGCDATTFDSLLTIEPDWIWGIEAKYFDVLKPGQIEREAQAVQRLARSLGYRQGGLLFLVPEVQLGTIIAVDGETRSCLARLMAGDGSAVTVSSWEVINEILVGASPALRDDLAQFWAFRNKNERYEAKVRLEAHVSDCAEWRELFLGKNPPPPGLPRLTGGGASGWSSIGRSSAEWTEVFLRECVVLAKQIVRRANTFGLTPIGRPKYVNLFRGRTYLQLHSHPNGVALAVPEGAGKVGPLAPHLQEIPVESLSGYYVSSNKRWLDGTGRQTSRAAAALLVPAGLEKTPEDIRWHEVDAVLRYAQAKPPRY